jgi:hypothetical protein
MDRQRHPDETTTRIAAFVPEDEDEVPWIRVLVRPGTADLQGRQDDSSIEMDPSKRTSRL